MRPKSSIYLSLPVLMHFIISAWQIAFAAVLKDHPTIHYGHVFLDEDFLHIEKRKSNCYMGGGIKQEILIIFANLPESVKKVLEIGKRSVFLKNEKDAKNRRCLFTELQAGVGGGGVHWSY